MKRILFVDDEQGVLEGLRRMLHSQRNEWEMRFALGGEEALRLLETTPVDVVVTDMRMPGIDGASLLQKVHDHYPDVLRIVLSGQFDRESGLRAAPVAHQFLSKPCEPAKLKAAINRSCQLGLGVPDEATRRFIGGIGALPSPPRVCTELLAAIADSSVSTERLARIVDEDVAITAKLLQLVNSGFFGHGREVSSVRAAIDLLGVDVLKQLVVSAGFVNAFRPSPAVHGFSLQDFERHARLTGQIAGRLAREINQESAAVLAGLLHDVGQLVLASFRPHDFGRALTLASQENRPPSELEYEIFGTSHAEIGGYLLSLWGLPPSIIDAISNHHRPLPPAPPEQRAPTLREVVIAANTLVHELDGASCPATPFTSSEMADRISRWRYIAQEIVQEC